GIELRLIQATTLPITSSYYLSALMVAIGLFAVYFGPEVIGRASEVGMFLLLPSLGVLVLVSLSLGEMEWLLPHRIPSLDAAASLGFWSVAASLQGYALLLPLAGMLPEARRLRRPLIAAILTSGIIVGSFAIAPRGIFTQGAV